MLPQAATGGEASLERMTVVLESRDILERIRCRGGGHCVTHAASEEAHLVAAHRRSQMGATGMNRFFKSAIAACKLLKCYCLH